MGGQTHVPRGEVPNHVPAELVRDWTYEGAPGADLDPHSANSVLTDGPEIFYSPTLISMTELGAWLITRDKLVREIIQDPETFSSAHLTGWSKLMNEEWKLIPIETDPPDHKLYRTLMNPLFSPKRMASLQDGIRQSAVELIEAMLKKDNCDFTAEFGQPFPVSVFLRMMGLPLDMTEQFLEWEYDLLHGKVNERRREGAKAIKAYLLDEIDKRRKSPSDDLISFAVTSEINGRSVDDDEALGICFVLFAAGLDTVASMLGFVFLHLAQHLDQQRALRNDPGLIPHAMEEMLRAYAVAVVSRSVTRDIDFHGIKMKSGDRVVMPIPVIARDHHEFENPNRVDFDRENIRHITFGSGPHRCIGSHLARVEIQIALEEWLKRVPEFRVTDNEKPVIHANGIWGLTSLPLTWT